MSDTPNLLLYFLDQEWRDDAACKNTSTDLFFPERGIPGEKIRDLCFSCPVRLDCLDDAINAGAKFGWSGGHPEEGRKAVRRYLNSGMDLETADSLVLADALSKVRQRKRSQKGKRYDTDLGDVVIGGLDLELASVS